MVYLLIQNLVSSPKAILRYKQAKIRTCSYSKSKLLGNEAIDAFWFIKMLKVNNEFPLVLFSFI
jgi:hypothetical protein